MAANETITKIIKAGSVITTTLLSFIIKPPVIDIEDSGSIHWNSLYIFIIGVLSILIYNKLSKTKDMKINGLGLLAFLVALIVSYGFLHNKYSRNCEYDLNKEDRFIISYSENFKTPAIKKIFESWKKSSNNTDNAINEILRAQDCNPSNIWNTSSLYVTFLGFMVLYLAIAIVLIILIISVSDKVLDP